jgi:hypothetical protein
MFAYRNSKLHTTLLRLSLAVMILAVLALSLPQPVSAAAMSFDIIAVKADDTVTIRTKDFPANVKFNVRMDVAGNRGIDGIVVAETNSGSGGTFDVTYRIPAELYGKLTIAIRFEAQSGGWFAYNWFNNRTTSTTTNPTIPVTSGKPYITFNGVKQNESVTVKGSNFPANTSMRVRVGPFYSFFRDYVDVTTVNTGSTGNFEFTVALPEVVKNVEMVTVRLDGSGRYAYNAFKNVNTGVVSPSPSIPTTGTSACQITAVSPNAPLPVNSDFDATWTIKNTSTKNWDLSSVDYLFVSGTKMHKYADRYDLTQIVKPGESIKIVVDMLAPASAGTYTSNWALVDGKTTICNFSLSQRVR